jgi:S-DNA-T family DNA segregation ATPase FtsK/SpoIIIE
VAGDSERLASTFRGLVPVVARQRTGLLLQPRGSTDGAVFGVDVAVPDAPLPGRGLLVDRGRVVSRIQVAIP